MLRLLNALRHDEHGVILSAEIVIVGSLLVIGMITGLNCLRQSVNSELQDVANAIGALDQSYAYSGHQKDGGWYSPCCAWTAGSSFTNCEVSGSECTGTLIGCHGTETIDTECCQEQGTPLHDASCSDCGGAAACTSCGSASCSGGCRSGSLDLQTGVPGVHVSEWPGFIQDPHLIRQQAGCRECTDTVSGTPVPTDRFRFPDHVWDSTPADTHTGN